MITALEMKNLTMNESKLAKYCDKIIVENIEPTVRMAALEGHLKVRINTQDLRPSFEISWSEFYYMLISKLEGLGYLVRKNDNQYSLYVDWY